MLIRLGQNISNHLMPIVSQALLQWAALIVVIVVISIIADCIYVKIQHAEK